MEREVSEKTCPISALLGDVWLQITSLLDATSIIRLLSTGDKRIWERIAKNVRNFDSVWSKCGFFDLSACFRTVSHFPKLISLVVESDSPHRFAVVPLGLEAAPKSLTSLTLDFTFSIDALLFNLPLETFVPHLLHLHLVDPASSELLERRISRAKIPSRLQTLNVHGRLKLHSDDVSYFPESLETIVMRNVWAFQGEKNTKTEWPRNLTSLGLVFEHGSLPPAYLPASLTLLDYSRGHHPKGCAGIDWATTFPKLKKCVFPYAFAEFNLNAIVTMPASLQHLEAYADLSQLDSATQRTIFSAPLWSSLRSLRSFAIDSKILPHIPNITSLTTSSFINNGLQEAKKLKFLNCRKIFSLGHLPPSLLSLTCDELSLESLFESHSAPVATKTRDNLSISFTSPSSPSSDLETSSKQYERNDRIDSAQKVSNKGRQRPLLKFPNQLTDLTVSGTFLSEPYATALPSSLTSLSVSYLADAFLLEVGKRCPNLYHLSGSKELSVPAARMPSPSVDGEVVQSSEEIRMPLPRTLKTLQLSVVVSSSLSGSPSAANVAWKQLEMSLSTLTVLKSLKLLVSSGEAPNRIISSFPPSLTSVDVCDLQAFPTADHMLALPRGLRYLRLVVDDDLVKLERTRLNDFDNFLSVGSNLQAYRPWLGMAADSAHSTIQSMATHILTEDVLRALPRSLLFLSITTSECSHLIPPSLVHLLPPQCNLGPYIDCARVYYSTVAPLALTCASQLSSNL